MGPRAKVVTSKEKVTLTVRIPLREKVALVDEAKKRNTTVTELIRTALRETLGIGKGRTEWPKPRALGVEEFKRADLYG